MSKPGEHSVIGHSIDIYPFKSQPIDLLSWAHMEKRKPGTSKGKLVQLF